MGSRSVNLRGRIRVGGGGKCVGSGCGSFSQEFGATVGSWRGSRGKSACVGGEEG